MPSIYHNGYSGSLQNERTNYNWFFTVKLHQSLSSIEGCLPSKVLVHPFNKSLYQILVWFESQISVWLKVLRAIFTNGRKGDSPTITPYFCEYIFNIPNLSLLPCLEVEN